MSTLVVALALWLPAAVPPDTTLIAFTSADCRHCQAMESTLRRMTGAGMRVDRIDIAARPDLARQFEVTAVPCYVLWANGRASGRVDGPASYDRLAGLFTTVARPPLPERGLTADDYRLAELNGLTSRPAASPPPPPTMPVEPPFQVRGQSPPPGPAGGAPPFTAAPPPRSFAPTVSAPPANPPPAAFAPPPSFGPLSPASAPAPLPPPSASPLAPASALAPAGASGSFGGASAPVSAPSQVDVQAAVERAMRATVRLRVEDGGGSSVGTGTIIDVHGDEALVVTCGHLFRGLKRGGRIWVDLFQVAGGRLEPLPPVPAQLLDFDLDRDIGVLSMRPGVPVQPARVAHSAYRPAKGDAVFSIGCDRGAPPSLRQSRVTAMDRYLGAPNIETAGAPVVGRSGGGLFSSDGLLIGVCNGADPQDDEGVFAGLKTVQWQLEAIGQRRVFEPQGPAAPAVASNAAPPLPITPARFESPAAPPTSPPTSIASADPTADVELVCVVRPRGGAAGAAETLVIGRPSPELLDRILREGRASSAAAPPIVRGQSPR